MGKHIYLFFRGYPAEEHFVTSDDGYVLALHRIPAGRDEQWPPLNSNSSFSPPRSRTEKIPVFLGHCLLGNSAIFALG